MNNYTVVNRVGWGNMDRILDIFIFDMNFFLCL